MSDIRPFVWVAAYRVVVCIECRYAYVADEIEIHLRGAQHGKTKEAAQKIAKAVQALPRIYNDQFALRTFEFPSPDIPEIPLLHTAQKDGLACTQCVFVCRTEKGIQRHYRTNHQWENPRKRGGVQASSQHTMPWRVGVQCQQFFKNRQASGWFEVNQPPNAVQVDASAPPRPTQESPADIVIRINEEQIQKFQDFQKEFIEVPDDKLESNLWLRRTGWAVHLQGLSRSRVLESIAPIRDDEPTLQHMFNSLQRAAVQGQKWASRDKVSISVLFDANRKDGDTRTKKPFHSKMEENTWEKYIEVMRCIICFVQRTREWHPKECPPYTFTGRQGRLWDTFTTKAREMGESYHTTDEDEAQLDRMCVDAIISLANHELKVSEYDNAMISALAVLGLMPGGGWHGASEYTPKYSAVMKMMRIFMVWQAVYEHEDEMNALARRGFTDAQAYDKCLGLIQRVRLKVYRFMVRSNRNTPTTPMSWIYNTKAYGMTIQNTTPARGHVVWTGSRITYKKIQFRMEELCDMIHGIIAEARETMTQLLMMADGYGHEAFPHIDWINLQDDHSEQQMGYSFLTDRRNEWAVDGKRWLMGKITQEKQWKKAWLGKAGSPFRNATVQRYGRLVDQFREQILILMHMTGGQPARGTEILGLRFRNTAGGGMRNIYIHNGLVSFVILYHKNINTSEAAKVITRYVPREVGSLLVWYLWLVLPFWQQVRGIIEQADEQSAFLWAKYVVCKSQPKGARTEDGSADEGYGESESEMEVDDCEDGTEDEDGDENDDRDEDEDEDESERQRGEPEKRAAEKGAAEIDGNPPPVRVRVKDAIECPGPELCERAKVDKVWYSERLRRRLQSNFTRFMGVSCDIISWRNIIVAIGNQYLDDIFRADNIRDDDEDEGYGSDEEEEDIMAAQTGHESRTRGTIYGLLVDRSLFGTAKQRDKYRRASIMWHHFLALTDREENGIRLGKRKREAWEASAELTRQGRFNRLRKVDIRGQLEQMIGEGASFRGCQEQVVRAIFRGMNPIVQITGTGGGKSLTFMLPAYCSRGDGVSIVIVPLVALREDLVRRCKESAIDVHVWTSRGANRAASIVLVTPESASTNTFRSFVNRLQARQQLDRVVLDECHMVLDAGETFRPELKAIGRTIVEWGVQTVLLTATLPPRDEKALFREMGFRTDRVVMFRVATTRKNIGYRVRYTRKTAQESIEQAVCEEVREMQRKQGIRVRMIVYGGTVSRTEEIGSLLACPVYHSSAADEQGKRRILQRWIREGGVIAATNALGVGLDVPDIRMVIHAGSPRRLRDYAQESGRGGRDGQRSEAVIVCHEPGGEGEDRQQAAGEGRWRQQHTTDRREADMVEYVQGDLCRRLVLDEVMDGRVDRIQCEEGEEVCDVCIGEVRGDEGWDTDIGFDKEEERRVAEEAYACMEQRAGEMVSDAKRRRKEEAEQMVMFVRYLEDWADVCVACRLQHENLFRHTDESCQDKGSELRKRIEENSEGIRNKLTMTGIGGGMEAYSGCNRCGIPQVVCERWEAEDQDEGRFRLRKDGYCQYGTLVFDVVCGFWEHCEGLFEEAIQTLVGEEKVGLHKAITWMGKKSRIGRIETNGLCQLFYYLVARWNQDTNDGIGLG